MKTINGRKTRKTEFTGPLTDEEGFEAFDDLVWRACNGDPDSVGEIATSVGTILFDQAELALGDFYQEAGDALHDLFVAMLERRLHFSPAFGPALPWLCGFMQAIAQQRRRERERDWGLDEDHE